jgi:hypothetical protein
VRLSVSRASFGGRGARTVNLTVACATGPVYERRPDTRRGVVPGARPVGSALTSKLEGAEARPGGNRSLRRCSWLQTVSLSSASLSLFSSRADWISPCKGIQRGCWPPLAVWPDDRRAFRGTAVPC